MDCDLVRNDRATITGRSNVAFFAELLKKMESVFVHGTIEPPAERTSGQSLRRMASVNCGSPDNKTDRHRKKLS